MYGKIHVHIALFLKCENYVVEPGCPERQYLIYKNFIIDWHGIFNGIIKEHT
jgi:hypothetical protein